LSREVLKTWLNVAGMVVFRSMILVKIPPAVSTPRERA